MANDLLKVGTRNKRGEAEPLKNGVIEDVTVSGITLPQGAFYEMPLFRNGGGSSVGVLCRTDRFSEIAFQWRRANGDYASDQRFMTSKDYSDIHYLRRDKITDSFRVLVYNQSSSDTTINVLVVTEFA